MKIILSPAKKMKYDDTPGISYNNLPVFLSEAGQTKSWLQSRSFAELKKLWGCNDIITDIE